MDLLEHMIGSEESAASCTTSLEVVHSSQLLNPPTVGEEVQNQCQPGLLQLGQDADSILCSGAGMDQLAPTACVATEKMPLVAGLPDASQGFPVAIFGNGEMPGQLIGERGDASPTQELSTRQIPVSDIKGIKSLFISSQSSSCNNSSSIADIRNPFSPKLPKLSLPSGDLSAMNILPIREMLCSNTSKSLASSVVQINKSYKDVLLQDTICLDSPDNLRGRQVIPTENFKKNITYPKALAPPNTYGAAIGSAPECGVLVDRVQGISLDTYALAIVKVIGESSIAFIGRTPGNEDTILIFVKTPAMAQKLVDEGTWIKGKWYKISFFQQPATKLIVSEVLPFLPDGLIIEAFAPYGTSVYPVLRKIPAAVKNRQFKGAYSYRREIYIIRSDLSIVFPDALNVTFLGVSYHLDVSTSGPKCFKCGSLLHTIGKCDVPVMAQDSAVPLRLQDLSTQVNSPHDSSLKGAVPISDKGIVSNANITLDKPRTGQSLATGHPVVKMRDFFTQCSIIPSTLVQANATLDKVVPESDVPPSKIKIKKRRKKVGGDFRSPETIDEDSVTMSFSEVGTEVTHDVTYDAQLAHCNDSSSTTVSGLCGEDNSTVVMSYDFFEPFIPPDNKRHKKSVNSSIQDVGSGLLPCPKVLDQLALECNDDAKLSNIAEGDQAFHEVSIPVSHTLHQDLQRNQDSKSQVEFYSVKKKSMEWAKSRTVATTEVLPPSDFSIIDDWLKRSASLKTTARRKLSTQFLSDYPDLKRIVTSAIESSSLYPPASARGRKVKDLLEDVNTIRCQSRTARVKKHGRSQ